MNSINQPALLYENLAVSEGNPILRDLLFSPNHQHLYVLNNKEVRCFYCTSKHCALWFMGTHKHKDRLVYAKNTCSTHRFSLKEKDREL